MKKSEIFKYVRAGNKVIKCSKIFRFVSSIRMFLENYKIAKGMIINLERMLSDKYLFD